jgi:hypothetical protein
VAEQQGSGAVTIRRVRGQGSLAKTALFDNAVHGLKADLFPELMEYMGLAVEIKGDDEDEDEDGDGDDDDL